MLKLFSKEKNSEKCTATIHLKESDMYCRECAAVLCKKCLKSHHKHTIIDIDDLFVEVVNQSGEIERLKKSIMEKESDKVLIQKTFTKDIQEEHDKEIESISKYFRDLHDQLHVKEVELKRELNSYHDDNTEKLVECLSKLDMEIQHSNDFLKEINIMKEQSEPDKMIFVEKYIQVARHLLQVKSPNNIYSDYHKFKVNPTISKQVVNSLETLNLMKRETWRPVKFLGAEPQSVVVALYNYKSGGDNELSFKEGDIITVLTKDTYSGGWWEGKLGHEKGWFPSNYCKELD
ncbi:actin binding protein E [Tieghemostelium lacteum]|uniref:Actin binding protein E n=1 Tax=Tieghemostelium lacteum TaxID=361077 RepID=A0A151ZCM1_TIELA|nr:actin binding protein E [Tieghemostelium lacteum]|eukprot:KYQ91624.1 actin binding protein E [Tieghemostelium lacteum]